MSIPQVSQGHKVAITGGSPPARVAQAAKVVILSVGSVPSRVAQAHMVLLVPANGQPPIPTGPRPGAIRKAGLRTARIFKGTTPITRVYAGESLTFAQE